MSTFPTPYRQMKVVVRFIPTYEVLMAVTAELIVKKWRLDQITSDVIRAKVTELYKANGRAIEDVGDPVAAFTDLDDLDDRVWDSSKLVLMNLGLIK